jgi:hypothetical protein
MNISRRLFSSIPAFSILATRQEEIFVREVETSTQSPIGIGLVNGSNKVFTLSYTPNTPTRLNMFLNGLLLREGGDYSITGKIVTFLRPAPTPPDRVEAQYYSQFTV